MNIGVPRYLIVGMAALFSAYHLVLAAYSLTQNIPMHDAPIFVAMALYALGSILSLVPIGPTRMPIWLAAFTVIVAIALLLQGFEIETKPVSVPLGFGMILFFAGTGLGIVARTESFLDGVAGEMNAATLVIGRAGATTGVRGASCGRAGSAYW